MDKIKKGIPFNVKLRTYIPHAIIGAIMLILYFILSLFLLEKTSISYTEIMRANDSKQAEIIMAAEKNEGESFYYLKNYYLKTNNKSISADILMVEENHYYNDNNIYFEGTLELNTCAISNNILKKYNLKIDDFISFIGIEKELKITKIINPQAGIDKEYNREGIIIINYDNSLLDKQFQYISFNTNQDFYYSLKSLYKMNDWKNDNAGIVIRNIIIFIISSILSILLCEIFIFKRRRKDYLIYLQLGKRKNKIFFNIFFENIIKFIIPLVLVFVFNARLTMYKIAYFYTFISMFSILFIAIIVYSLVENIRIR